MNRKIIRFCYAVLAVFQFLFFLTAVQRPAYAYVDPGSGILAVQFLSSIIGGGIFFLRRRLKLLFFPAKPPKVFPPNSGIEL